MTLRHYGPGDHPGTGTSQGIHAGHKAALKKALAELEAEDEAERKKLRDAHPEWDAELEAWNKLLADREAKKAHYEEMRPQYQAAFKTYVDGLEPETKRAVAWYSDAGYRVSNALLRGEDVTSWGPLLVAEATAAIPQIDKAIAAYTTIEDVELWRGVRATAANGLRGLQVGDEYTDLAFGSWTTSEGVTDSFTSEARPFRFRTILPKGTHAIPDNPFQQTNEHEYTLARGNRWRVVAVALDDLGDGLSETVVTLELVHDAALDNAPAVRHYGPGNHPSGSSQDAHAGGKSVEQAQDDSLEAKVRRAAERIAMRRAAEERLVKLGYDTVDLGMMRPENVAVVTETLAELAKRYPAVLRDLSVSIGIDQSGQGYAVTFPWFHQVSINFDIRWFEDAQPDKLLEALSVDLKSGWSSVDGVSGVVRHEFGHVVDHWLNREKSADPKPPTVSRYAGTDDDEAFAELFAVVEQGAAITDPRAKEALYWIGEARK